ncbi:carboxymuconolactone decarboxylase family protein [Roseococcus sp.]|uniref:carboxymuconolactone decarboxylase family protein n=1 Tax=Roseococcus sp. TaxID=2109646 RepID=UPI003BAD0078
MNETQAHEVLRAKGRAEMREILGSAYTEARDTTTNPFNSAVRALSEEMAYATLWTRPGLDRKQRSLITLGMICALNHPHELRIHLVAALNNGCTAEEISEVFTHAVAYCGFPAAIDALRLAEQVLKEQGAL